MLVPSKRLIVWSGLVLAPLSLAVLAEPSLTVPATAAVLLILLIVAIDALSALGSLDGITGAFPEVVRLTKDRPSQMDVFLRHDGARRRTLRLALSLPPGIESEHGTLTAEIPEDTQEIRLEWPCTPAKRGRYTLRNIYLEGPSRFGLWSLYRPTPAQTELRVYPDIRHEQKHVAALFLNRGAFGIHAQRQVGKGREFEKLREYIPGDSYEDIHWKATARRGRPVTKDYQIERTQEVYVIIDASRLSGRLMPGENGAAAPQLERLLASAMVLGLVAERQGDLFGLVTFQDSVRHFVRARKGRAHFGVCRDALYTLEPRDVNPDFEEVCSFIRLKLRRRALLIFLTNLDDPLLAESFTRNVELLSRHHLVLANMPTPPGVAPLFTGPPVQGLDDLYDHLSGHLQWRGLQELKQVLHRHNVTLTLIEHADLTARLVTQYLGLKQRQLL